ncbi:MAG: bifunctional cobalt-precorrin-7 (C(5))-methyltransferase/cobalt-precorrin-6B (C(15))-methyltransferase, partial [Chloroflexaceae bacterium]|nr:bifunctional cobalt-precorrin-7 (C(5))-methyltransferase/cobalt-precorrin-6B (C(15))-methyltransferase [Chloroflexaceae bacterium]
MPPGLPDDAFSTTGGLLTKREIRLLALGELALGDQEVLWDIGAGSGAVAIEAAR